MIKKIKKFITNPQIRFGYLTKLGFYDNMSDKEFLKRKFKVMMGKKLDLENPQTFNEKLQWLKLYNRMPEYTTMVDKYAVKKYVADKIGEEYIIPTLGVWDDPDEIDFEALPNQFVLKCNHNSGTGMCICKDKYKLDINKVKAELRRGLKEDYFLPSREWPYKNVPRKIIAEKYMEDGELGDLRDYKFYCFNGEVKAVMINSGRNSEGTTKADYFDENYNYLDFKWGYEHSKTKPKKPLNFEKMIELAEYLSKNIAHLRVDFYEVNKKIYFGELTFFDGGGFALFDPEEWDYKLGSYIKLPDEKIIND